MKMELNKEELTKRLSSLPQQEDKGVLSKSLMKASNMMKSLAVAALLVSSVSTSFAMQNDTASMEKLKVGIESSLSIEEIKASAEEVSMKDYLNMYPKSTQESFLKIGAENNLSSVTDIIEKVENLYNAELKSTNQSNKILTLTDFVTEMAKDLPDLSDDLSSLVHSDLKSYDEMTMEEQVKSVYNGLDLAEDRGLDLSSAKEAAELSMQDHVNNVINNGGVYDKNYDLIESPEETRKVLAEKYTEKVNDLFGAEEAKDFKNNAPMFMFPKGSMSYINKTAEATSANKIKNDTNAVKFKF